MWRETNIEYISVIYIRSYISVMKVVQDAVSLNHIKHGTGSASRLSFFTC